MYDHILLALLHVSVRVVVGIQKASRCFHLLNVTLDGVGAVSVIQTGPVQP